MIFKNIMEEMFPEIKTLICRSKVTSYIWKKLYRKKSPRLFNNKELIT